MITTEKQAEEFIYRSYMRAAKKLKYDAPDSEKRHPELTSAIIHQLDTHYRSRNILVTGSKGKGSVSIMIQSVLRAHGKCAGLVTSPHIEVFNERIRIDDEYIPDTCLAAACEKLAPTIELIESTMPENAYISPIGIQVLAALLWFGGRTDINVFECGKGAQYDDVNNLTREYSVINRIFAEHTRELGASAEDIARDKAHIIKKGQKCAYTAKQDENILDIIKARAENEGVGLKIYGRDYYCENVSVTDKGTVFDAVCGGLRFDGIRLSLLGGHQAENFALALAVCTDILGADISAEKVKAAAQSVKWRGRLDIVSHDPLVIADACINRVSAQRAAEVIGLLGCKRLACIIAVPSDKDYTGVYETIRSLADMVIFTKAENPHYKFDGIRVPNGAVWAKSYTAALERAKAAGADAVCVLGTAAVLPEVYAQDHRKQCSGEEK